MRTKLLVAAVLVLAPSPVLAQVRNTQFAVRATVVAECTVTAEDLNFGNYTAASDTRGQTNITVQCTPGQSATINLDGGASGNPRNRLMVGPGSLNYKLFRDAAMQDEINTAFWTWRLRRSENTGEPVTYVAYGSVPAGQDVPAGDYVDTVRVTVIY